MPHLSPATWCLWMTSAFLQCALIALMVHRGAWRKWPSLFAFLITLSLRDGILLADLLVWKSCFLYFWGFMWTSLVAAAIEVWMICQICVALAGVTPWIRRAMWQLFPLMSAAVLVVTLSLTFVTPTTNSDRMLHIANSLDQSVSFAWLFSFFVCALAAETLGIEWSPGVKGVALGFLIEIGAGTADSWLTALHLSASLLNYGKLTLYIGSLLIWAQALGPKKVEAVETPIHARYVGVYRWTSTRTKINRRALHSVDS